jgi:hypothetical protein
MFQLIPELHSVPLRDLPNAFISPGSQESDKQFGGLLIRYERWARHWAALVLNPICQNLADGRVRTNHLESVSALLVVSVVFCFPANKPAKNVFVSRERGDEFAQPINDNLANLLDAVGIDQAIQNQQRGLPPRFWGHSRWTTYSSVASTGEPGSASFVP